MKVTEKLSNDLVKVAYFGQEVLVHKWANWIATDYDGMMYEFRQEPEFEYGEWNSKCSTGPNNWAHIGQADLEDTQPADTLQQIFPNLC